MSTEFTKHLLVDTGSKLTITATCTSSDVILRGRLKYDGGTLVQIAHANLYNTSETLTLPGNGEDGTLRIFARFNGVPTRVDIELQGEFNSKSVGLKGKLSGDDGDTQMGVINLYID